MNHKLITVGICSLFLNAKENLVIKLHFAGFGVFLSWRKLRYNLLTYNPKLGPDDSVYA
jgi:hypothetical protein